MNWQLDTNEKPTVQKQLFVELDDNEKIIYNYLKHKDKELLDVIAVDCDIPSYKIAGLLLNMELKGVIRPLPGKLFEVI